VVSSAIAARLTISHSVLSGGTYGVFAQATGVSGHADVALSDSTLTNNTTAAISVSETVAGATATVTADTNWLSENGTGFLFGAGTPTIYTRSNNTLKFNTADVSGGALTPLAAQ
jgi:hypothetical protein